MKHYLLLDLKDDPQLIREYENWHRPDRIWKEIPEGIRKVGIKNMELYRFANRLLMVVETDDQFEWDKQMEVLSQLPRQREWEVFMDRFQQRLPEGGNADKWQRMVKIFSLSACQSIDQAQ